MLKSLALLLALVVIAQGSLQKPMENPGMFEGDIAGDIKITPGVSDGKGGRTLGQVENNNYGLWTNGIVYYAALSSTFTAAEQQTIRNAMTHIETQTRRPNGQPCITFTQRTNQQFYLNFIKSGGCWSYVGRFKGGPQDISLVSGCFGGFIPHHEMKHALGFWHEQSRPDRNSYLRYYPQNVQSGMAHNFDLYTTGIVYWHTYDVSSIMQYEWNAFSSNGQPTLTNLDGSTTNLVNASQRTRMTVQDVESIQRYYGCI